MKYEAGERDLVMLQHKFVVEWQDGKTVRLFPSSVVSKIALMLGCRTLSPRLWRRMAIQLVIPPWLLPLVFLAASLLSWFSMVSSTRLVCSGRTPRSSVILFVKFWRKRVLEWLKRFYKPVAHCSTLEFLSQIYCTSRSESRKTSLGPSKFLALLENVSRDYTSRSPPESEHLLSHLLLAFTVEHSLRHCDTPSWGRQKRIRTPGLSLLRSARYPTLRLRSRHHGRRRT